MLFRKAEKEIKSWINEGKKALLVDGARQVGKTFLIDALLEESGIPFVKIDLIEESAMAATLEKACEISADAVYEALSYSLPRTSGNEKPIVFIDEVQRCPELITMSKYLVIEGKCRYIFSGSLLGLALMKVKSFPVGYMDTLTMYPLDYEEFVINLGFNEASLSAIRKGFEAETPINEHLHNKAMDAFKRYLLVGGLPEAVDEYISTNNLGRVRKTLSSIKTLYKKDFTQKEKGNPLILERIYDLIPWRLEQESRRFVVSDVEPVKEYPDYQDDFYWLSRAGAVIPVYNVSSPSLPYEISDSNSSVKLFYNDLGLLTSSYGEAFGRSVLFDEKANLGGVYENFAAVALLSAHGSAPYYFKQRKIGELDFLVSYHGESVAIEVKSGHYYQSHPSLSKLMAVPNYGLNKAFVLCNDNVSKIDNVTYLPIYMAGLIR